LCLIDSTLIIHIYGTVINTEEIGLSSDYKPESVEDLEHVIGLLNKLQVCHGSILTSKYTEIKSTFGPQFVESYGQWRHSNCTKIIINDINGR